MSIYVNGLRALFNVGAFEYQANFGRGFESKMGKKMGMKLISNISQKDSY